MESQSGESTALLTLHLKEYIFHCHFHAHLMNQTLMVFQILWSAMQYSRSGYFALHEASLQQHADHAHLALQAG